MVGYRKGSYIQNFVSAGPKFYAFLIKTSKSDELREICKVKGVALNYVTKQTVNR